MQTVNLYLKLINFTRNKLLLFDTFEISCEINF